MVEWQRDGVDGLGEEAGVWLRVLLPAVDGGAWFGFCPRLGTLCLVVPSRQDRCQAGGSSHKSSTCSRLHSRNSAS